LNGNKQILTIGNHNITPPLFLAPMAGIAHSAFRRLVADFGGHGALFTEMLSTNSLAVENLLTSPFTRRRPVEGAVVYQLRLTGLEDMAGIIEKLKTIDPFGIDINLGCPAPEVRRMGGGTVLFDDYERLKKALESVRKHWPSLLTVKCRLGRQRDDWQTIFNERMKLFEGSGVDAVIVHPRFSGEKLKRRARWELFPWIASLTRLPIIANGDITSPGPARILLENGTCKGLMIGRMAVVKPWIFREFRGEPVAIDYGEVWKRAFEYITNDFMPEKAIGRIKQFSTYFARNFIFGHQFFKAIQGARDLATIKSRAMDFLSREPEIEKTPSVVGI
jgi:tRNA-dihydrouridine synthase B